MNQIIDSQRPIHDKTGLGYNQKNDKRSYVEFVRESCKRENYESLKENIPKVEMKKQEEDQRTWRKFPTKTHNNDLIRHAPSRRPPMSRYQNFFYGLCYACNNYGHKVMDCRTYTRYINRWGRNIYEHSKYQAEENHIRRSQLTPNRNYNRLISIGL